MSNKVIFLGLIAAGILIGGAIVWTNYQTCQTGTCSQSTQEQLISSQQAGEKLVDFINQKILAGQGSTAALIETLEEAGFYKVKFDVEGQKVEWWITRDGRFVFPQTIDLQAQVEPAQETGKEIGNFSVSADEICREDGKPIVYFFGSQSCPHCVWEHPIVQEVIAKFGDNISFHDNMDGDADKEILDKYSTGGVPTLVLGCKYYRVGSGESLGEEKEVEALTNLICKLTDNKPSEICPK